jgi:hypothetical protein
MQIMQRLMIILLSDFRSNSVNNTEGSSSTIGRCYLEAVNDDTLTVMHQGRDAINNPNFECRRDKA